MDNKPKICTCKNCLGVASWKPEITVRLPENDNVFRLELDCPVCSVHKDNLKLSDLISDSVLKQIQKLFKSKFIYEPKIDNMILNWEPLILFIYDTKGNPLNESVKVFTKEK